jgi:hypothetical protein
MRLGRARLLASIAAITTLAGALAAAAIPAAAASASASTARVALAGSAAVPLPAGAVRLGAVPAQAEITIDVALNLGNEAGLDARLNGLANRKSPYFRQFLGQGQFGPAYGLPLPQIEQVESTLRSLGLNPGSVDVDRLQIPVTATAAAIQRAFGVALVDYRLSDGRVAYANSAAPRVPASIAPYVEGVLGLDDVYLAQSDAELTAAPVARANAVRRPAALPPTAKAPAGSLFSDLATPRLARPAGVPTPCTAATDAAVAADGYTANQFASHYYMSTLYELGDLGRGVHVAVAELEPNLATDITAYETCYGIKTPVKYITVDPGLAAGVGSGEAALDIENIAGLAPDVTIDVYQAPNTTLTTLLDIATKVADRDQDQVFSLSWGLCESLSGSALLAHYQTVFKAINSEGITVVAASGDTGSTGCFNSRATDKVLSPEAPASSNYVLSIGGTSMETATPLSPEVTWNASAVKNGASGGGVSAFCMPNYQDLNQHDPQYPPIPGLISKYSKTSKPCVNSGGNPHGYEREVPDLSAQAVGGTYPIYWDKAWHGSGGTSGATTLVAAEAALIDASPYCSSAGWDSGPAGILPQALYSVASADFDRDIYQGSGHAVLLDITARNNDYTPSGYTGGLFKATRGYDMATGLGAPLLTGTIAAAPAASPGLASDVCDYFAPARSRISTTSVSPAYGRAGRAITLTVHGTGMIAVPYTDLAYIYNGAETKSLYLAYAFCSSHTTCKVTLPAFKAGSYQVELSPVDLLPCLTCKRFAKFQLANPPHVAGLSPSSGHRGTRITIRGSNFIGVSAVDFGGAKGTRVKVISATKLTVIVPAGSGTVQVKVVAAGGASNTKSFTY